MHRVLALLLVPALMATPGAVSSLHTHAYDDHDHPEHQHGLSAHEHDVARSHPDDDAAHVEECDPAEHLVSFAFVCAAPGQVPVVEAELMLPVTPDPTVEMERTAAYTDVRVHGPPPFTQPSPRAPPLNALA